MLTVNYAYLELTANDVVLDLGCGEGRHSMAVPHPNIEATVIGLDLNLNDLTTARAKHREHRALAQQYQLPDTPPAFWLCASGEQLPLADHSIDVIICSEVLEHIHDYAQVLTEINRVLKPGGRLAVSVPRQWPERLCWAFSEEYSQTPGGHVRIFNSHKLRREIQTVGFEFLGQHFAHALHSPYWWLKCLLWDKPEHFLVKAYHRFLVWDLLKAPWQTRLLEQLLNPLMGKSVVLYFVKPSALKAHKH